MRIEAFAASDIGQKRSNNQDSFFIDDVLRVFIVCDGMGGHAAGDVAAQKAVQFTVEHLRANRAVIERAADSPEGCYRVLELAEDAFQNASLRLYELACRETSLAGMGTTLTMLIVVEDKAIMSHVGDSRLYLFRENETHLLSTDHTLANELRQLGARREEVEAGRFAHMLTRSIGTQEVVEVESLMFDLLPSDRCLLCSDGLSRYFTDPAELCETLTGDLDPSTTASRLVEIANERGGQDNITALILRMSADPKSSSANSQRLRQRMEALSSSFLFQGLPLNLLMRIANHAVECEWRAGQNVISQGHPVDGMQLVVCGGLQVDGDDRVLSRGDTIGATALQIAHDAPRGVLATEASRTLLVSRKAFQQLTRRRPKLGRRLLQRLAETLSHEVVRLSASSPDLAVTDTWVR